MLESVEKLPKCVGFVEMHDQKVLAQCQGIPHEIVLSLEGTQRFLGLCTYLQRFIKNLSIESENLRQLYLKQTEWHRSEEKDQEFHKLTMMLVNAQTLRYCNLNDLVIME